MFDLITAENQVANIGNSSKNKHSSSDKLRREERGINFEYSVCSKLDDSNPR
jgi:hypothetical protein